MTEFPLYKFIIVGEQDVGKSCLLLRYSEKTFSGNYNVTIGVEFQSKLVKIDEKDCVQLQIWVKLLNLLFLKDTTGQESFRSIIRSFYRNVVGIFLVYSITKKKSLMALNSWLKEAKENCQENAITVLIGAKCDLENEREVSREDVQKFVEYNNIDLCFETSSRTNTNIELAFYEAAKLFYSKNPIELESLQKTQSDHSIQLTNQKQEKGFPEPILQQPKAKNCC